MLRLRQTLRAGSACLAALMTLVSGAPHLDCICPDGHIKSFCLSLVWGQSACCGGECCPASAPGGCCCQAKGADSVSHHGVRACCRRGAQHPADSAANPHGQLTTTCCKKTLAGTDTTAVSPRVDVRSHHLAVALVPGVSAPQVSGLPSAEDPAFCRHSYSLPPPTDRVVAFQHFII
jgi:hypothetical protein